MKLSVHCAFEEGFVGLRFVFDALTTENSTGIRQNKKNQYPVQRIPTSIFQGRSGADGRTVLQRHKQRNMCIE
jgi:hypothetical protein